jgi:hypothetical protein
MTDYAKTLELIRPNSRWRMNGEDYSDLEWLSEDPKPTKKTLDDAWPQVQARPRAQARIQAERAARYQLEADPLFFKAQRDDSDHGRMEGRRRPDPCRPALPRGDPMNLTDLAHRSFWTFVQSVTGMLTAGAIFDLDLTVLHAVAAGAIADVLVVVKEYARTQLP